MQRAWWRGQPVAVKMLSTVGPSTRASELAAFQAELAILSRTQHSHVVHCYGGCLEPPQVNVGLYSACVFPGGGGGMVSAFAKCSY